MIRKKLVIVYLLMLFVGCTKKTDRPVHESTHSNVTPKAENVVNPFDLNKKVSTYELKNAEAELNKVFENYFKSQTFIEIDEAKKMWGEEKYEREAFINGDEKTKTSMVADFVEQQIAVGKSTSDIEHYVGRRSGYFFNEQIVAVIFKRGKPKTTQAPATKAYQLVFLTDDTEKIVDVRIHRQ